LQRSQARSNVRGSGNNDRTLYAVERAPPTDRGVVRFRVPLDGQPLSPPPRRAARVPLDYC